MRSGLAVAAAEAVQNVFKQPEDFPSQLLVSQCLSRERDEKKTCMPSVSPEEPWSPSKDRFMLSLSSCHRAEKLVLALGRPPKTR